MLLVRRVIDAIKVYEVWLMREHSQRLDLAPYGQRDVDLSARDPDRGQLLFCAFGAAW